MKRIISGWVKIKILRANLISRDDRIVVCSMELSFAEDFKNCETRKI